MKKKRNIGYAVLNVISFLLIVLGIYNCMDVFQGYLKGRDEYTSLNRKYTTVYGTEKEEEPEVKKKVITEIQLPADAPEPLDIDWEELRQINGDIVGWIQIPALGLSYPVLQGEDNDQYLHRGFYGEYLFAGSIFLDCKNSSDFSNYNSIIYGHNMLDGSMFASLKNFNDPEVLHSCPYIWVLTPDKQNLYEIFSVHETLADSSCYVTRMDSVEEWQEWSNVMKLSSAVDTDVWASAGDRVITLSTCTNNSQTRQVVQAKRVYVADITGGAE